MTLGDKIRKYRTLKGLTQAQLGSMVKLTGDRIRQYENDVRKPKDGKLLWYGKTSIKKTFLRQEKGQQHIRSCDVSLAHLIYHSFLT